VKRLSSGSHTWVFNNIEWWASVCVSYLQGVGNRWEKRDLNVALRFLENTEVREKESWKGDSFSLPVVGLSFCCLCLREFGVFCFWEWTGFFAGVRIFGFGLWVVIYRLREWERERERERLNQRICHFPGL
jgi:hypothetical protein